MSYMIAINTIIGNSNIPLFQFSPRKKPLIKKNNDKLFKINQSLNRLREILTFCEYG